MFFKLFLVVSENKYHLLNFVFFLIHGFEYLHSKFMHPNIYFLKWVITYRQRKKFLKHDTFIQRVFTNI